MLFKFLHVHTPSVILQDGSEVYTEVGGADGSVNYMQSVTPPHFCTFGGYSQHSASDINTKLIAFLKS